MCILFSFLMNAGCQSSRAASLIGFYSMEWRIQSLRAVQCQANSLCWSHIPLIYLKLPKLKNSITRAEPWMYLEVSTNILHRISSAFRSCVNFSKLRSLAKNTPPTGRVSEGNKKLQKCPAHNNCQARVQVPNPLSQQAPNPDPKVRLSLKNPKTQFFRLGWHNNHMGHHPTPPHPTTFKHEGVLR